MLITAVSGEEVMAGLHFLIWGLYVVSTMIIYALLLKTLR